MSPARWTNWQPLALGWSPSPAVLAETLDGGQAFRWWRTDETGDAAPSPRGVWTGLWSDHLAQLRLHHSALQWRAPAAMHARVARELPRYLGADLDWPALVDSLPWRSDPHLARCLAAYPGLRLLRQPFGETLLGFLCSATKQIPQIKQMLALLAERHGLPLSDRTSGFLVRHSLGDGGTPRSEQPSGHKAPPTVYVTAGSQLSSLSTLSSQLSTSVSALPTWPALATIPESDLRACQLGFRARFIHETALFLAAHPGWLDETEQLPYAAAKARLMELPGVGEKIADCVLLFGAGRLEAFPVDTWVLKSLARRYDLVGWKPAQVARFGRAHFGPLAGLAQQFLFSWERAHGSR
ncbi:MAG: DNA-binding protein [Opitutae bacterium]|nr:DNA-binding protein [Opitutae bacterium]